MTAISRRKMVRGRRAQRGFSLIELGIVIAVIAVLAAVVIFGRGFIAAGRITKAVEATNTIRKSASAFAGLQGGALTQPINGTALATLAARQLLPPLHTDGQWYVSGASGSPDSIAIEAIFFGQQTQQNTGPRNVVAITVRTPTATMAEDVWGSVKNDPNLNKDGQPIGNSPPCSTGTTNAGRITVCFNL